MNISASRNFHGVTLGTLAQGSQKIGDNDKIRATRHGFFDKSIQLYSSSKASGKFSLPGTRQQKRDDALSFIKGALANTARQVGDPHGTLAKEFDRLTKNLGTEIKGSSYKKLLTEAQKAVDHHVLIQSASPFASLWAEAGLESLHNLPNAPQGTVSGTDNVFRSNSMTKDELQSGLDKLLDGQTDQMSPKEAFNGAQKVWGGKPVMPMDKLLTILDNDAIPGSVGRMTARNSLKDPNAVPDNSPQEKHEAGNRLKELIDNTLSPKEKAALKERVDFIAQLPALAQAKFGACNPQVANNPQESLTQWTKSMGISYASYLGIPTTELYNTFEGAQYSGSQRGQDFITALLLHKDTIFND